MGKKFDPSTLDPKAKASYKSIRMLGMRFGSEDFKAVERTSDYRKATVAAALLMKYHNEVVSQPLTYGDVSKLLEAKQLPKKYRDLYDPKYSKEKATVPPKKVSGGVTVNAEAIKRYLASLSPEDKAELVANELF